MFSLTKTSKLLPPLNLATLESLLKHQGQINKEVMGPVTLAFNQEVKRDDFQEDCKERPGGTGRQPGCVSSRGWRMIGRVSRDGSSLTKEMYY